MSAPIRLIQNARAAEDDALAELLAEYHDRRIPVETFTPKESSDIGRLAAEGARSGCKAIIAAGGDGTLNAVVNGVMSAPKPCPVGVLPFGTANDFATACGITDRTLEDQLRLIRDSQPTLIDLGKVNERYFINVASGGFGAEVTAETPPLLKDFLGGFAYSITGMFKAIARDERIVQAKINGTNWRDALLFLTVANSRLAGGGYVVAPKASLIDGLLDIALVPEIDLEDLPDLFANLFENGSLTSKHGLRLQAKRLHIEAGTELPLNLDGEAIEPSRMFRFEVVPHCLPFHLPEEFLSQSEPKQ